MGAAKPRLDLVRDGVVDQGHRAHLGFGNFASFANGVGDLAGFAQANPNAALLVAGNYQRAKAEAAPAFDYFGRAIDENDFFRQLGHALAGGVKHFRAAFGRSPVASRRPAETSTTAAAASARALTLPWYFAPLRSNTTCLMPLVRAVSAAMAPIRFALATLALKSFR